VVTAKDAKGLKYKMSEEFTVEAFETFVTALKAGELEPFLKSGMLKHRARQFFESTFADPDTNQIILLNRMWMQASFESGSKCDKINV
jgi:hypothetical protein